MSNEKRLPFKPARLGDRNGDMQKKWYIEYKAWDAQAKKLRRKFDYEINTYKTEQERRTFARVRIRQINNLLAKGYHFDAEKMKHQQEHGRYPMLKNAYLWVLERKKPELSKPTFNSYSSTINVFNEWLSGTKWKHLSVNRLTTAICYEFIDEISDRGVSPRTINSRYLSYLKSFHNYWNKRNGGKNNPWLDIDKKKEVISRIHIPFTNEEKKQLKALISKVDKELWFFIQFMYYGFMRPNEIRQMQKYNIMLERNMIYIDPLKAKNKKAGYVAIPNGFRPVLEEYTKGMGAHDCLFPARFEELQFVSKNYMADRFRKLLERFDFGKGHTFYGWKHTGVVDAYKAGIDIKSLQAQLRHYSLEETDIYLRNLGLFGVDAILKRFPSL